MYLCAGDYMSFSKNLFASQKLILGMAGELISNSLQIEIAAIYKPLTSHPEPGLL